MTTATVLRLARRPVGAVARSDFAVAKETLPQLADGEVRVRNFLFSIDPTLRIWMDSRPQYMPPVEIGEVMRCLGMGVVEESRNEKLPVGTVVTGRVGWQDRFNAGPDFGLNPIPQAPGVAYRDWVGSLGWTGAATAYFGYEICKLKAGETLVVTGAAGNVGSLVGQLGKLAGGKVIGIAGGPAKCARVVEKYGFDACIDYKNSDVAEELKMLAPNGVDALFENVGGDIMDEVMGQMNNFGRISVCGLISAYNEGKVPGPKNFDMILMRRLTIQGFIVSDVAERFAECYEKMVPLVASGQIKYDYHELEGGMDGIVDAVNFLLEGKNQGKLLYRIAADPTPAKM